MEAPVPVFCIILTTGAFWNNSPPDSILIADIPWFWMDALNFAFIPLPPLTRTSGADK